MKINDLLPFMNLNAAPQTAFCDASTAAANASKEMSLVSNLWLLTQKVEAGYGSSSGDFCQTPAILVTENASKSFPIYVVREPGLQSIGPLQGLRVTPEFFKAFPPAVRLGLIWGLGEVVTEQRLSPGIPSHANGYTIRQTYGQAVRGGPQPLSHNIGIKKVFGDDLAKITQDSWNKYMNENNLLYGSADFEKAD